MRLLLYTWNLRRLWSHNVGCPEAVDLWLENSGLQIQAQSHKVLISLACKVISKYAKNLNLQYIDKLFLLVAEGKIRDTGPK